MGNILLYLQADTAVLNNISEADVLSFSIWFYIAIAEFVIIGFLLWKLMKKSNTLDLAEISKAKLRKAKNTKVNMEELMNNINGSKALYKTLSSACHPDRFVNSDKQELAQEIFQGISHHKRDFQKLSELKKRAEMELNINFK